MRREDFLGVLRPFLPSVYAYSKDEKVEGVEEKIKTVLGIFHQCPTAVGPTVPPTKSH